MFNRVPLVLFLALASAISKDHFKRQRFFGLPAESTNVKEPDESAIDLASNSGGRAPSTFEEHMAFGATEDSAFLKKFLELLLPKSGISSGTGWNMDHGTDLLDSRENQSSVLPQVKFVEGPVLPDIKIVKYELPNWPEVKPLDPYPLPDVEFPEVKILKYELPPLPELTPLELPPFPEFSLPDLKILKYELPPFPEMTFPELPELQPLELPDIIIMKYELPDLDIKPLDIPPFPEINFPDFKIIKYELPPIPEMKPLDLLPLQDVTFPEVKTIRSELRTMPEIKPKKIDFWMKRISEDDLEQVNIPKRPVDL